MLVWLCMHVCQVQEYGMCFSVSTPLPLSENFKWSFSLSPALHHPAGVHGCQESSGDTSAHGPEGLEKHQHQIQQPNMATEELQI